MADSASMKIVVLWAMEVRAASRALDALCGMHANGSTATLEQKDAALSTALEACYAALNNELLSNDEVPIVVAERPMHTRMSRRAFFETGDSKQANEPSKDPTP